MPPFAHASLMLGIFITSTALLTRSRVYFFELWIIRIQLINVMIERFFCQIRSCPPLANKSAPTNQ